MVSTRPNQWRMITPILSFCNFLGICIVGIIGWFMVRTIDQFDKHLDRIEVKWERQNEINQSQDHRITLIQATCCNRENLKEMEVD